MPKINPLYTFTSLDSSALPGINANFGYITTAINNTLSRDGSTPNVMNANLDMNSFQILNAVFDLTNTTGFLDYDRLVNTPFIPTKTSEIINDSGFITSEDVITLTTVGNSGPATLAGVALNVPEYTLAGLGGTSLTGLSATTPLFYNNTTGAFTIQVANTSQAGYLTSADWNTFNSKQPAGTYVTSATVSGTGLTLGGTATDPTFALNLSNSNTWAALQIFPDTMFKLTDDADATKTAQFNVGLITTGIAANFNLPPATTTTALTLAVTSTLTQTFSGTTTFSGATVTIGTSTSASTYGLGTGATLTATTKAVNIGTAGVSGSTTNIALGSAISGALGTFTINSPTTTFGTTATAFNIKDTVFTLQDDGDVTKQAKFQLSGFTTGNTRTFTLPDTSDTVAVLAAAQSLTNKKLGSLTSNGFVTTSGGDGTLGVDTKTYADNAFKTISVSGQSDVVADSATDTLTFVNGTGISITTNAATDSITITSSGTASIAQRIASTSGAVATGSTTIPNDDTIPQITEGDQYLTATITPTSSSNLLRIDVLMNVSNSGSPNTLAALFQDSTANALTATIVSDTPSAGRGQQVILTYFMTAGTTSATTFRVRMGGDSAATLTFNGTAGARRFGGVMLSSIAITEYTL